MGEFVKRNKTIISIIVLIIILTVLISIFVIKEIKDNQSNNNPETFTVIFVDYDGTVLKEESGLERGSNAIAPSDPLRDEYIFIGWDKEFDNITENITVTALYEKANKPKLVVNTIDSKAGNTKVLVTIEVINNPDIASIALMVTYDEALVLTNITYNEKIGGYSMPPATMDSPTKLTWISPLENVSGDFIFVTLEFTVASDAIGKLPITITYDPDDIYDMTEENIDFSIINGAINVVE